MLTLSVFNPLSFETRTETAVQLAVAACQQGLRVGLIDASPNRNDLLAWLDARELNAEVEGELCLWENLLGEPLNRSLNELAERQNDIVVVDTPTDFDTVADAVLALSDLVVVPVTPDCIVRRFLVDVERRLVASRAPYRFVLVRAGAPDDEVTLLALEALRAFGPVANTVISHDDAIAAALKKGLAVSEYEPDGRAAAQVSSLWREVWGAMSFAHAPRGMEDELAAA